MEMMSEDELGERYQTENYILSHLATIANIFNRVDIDFGVFDGIEDSFLRRLAINLASVYSFVEYIAKEYDHGGDQ